MTAISFYNSLVSQSLTARRCDRAEAERLTAQAHPDVLTLARASGATEQRVRFLNATDSLGTPADKAAALAEFKKLIKAKQDLGHDYAEAWRLVAGTNPDLERRAFAVSGDKLKPVGASEYLPDNPAGFVSTPAVTDSSVPTRGPKNAAMLYLPATVSQDEFAAAWEGNGRTFAVRNPAKIFDGIVEFRVKRDGTSKEAAIASCKSDFPKLWALVENLAKAAA